MEKLIDKEKVFLITLHNEEPVKHRGQKFKYFEDVYLNFLGFKFKTLKRGFRPDSDDYKANCYLIDVKSYHKVKDGYLYVKPKVKIYLGTEKIVKYFLTFDLAKEYCEKNFPNITCLM